jgi:hypothetical protein
LLLGAAVLALAAPAAAAEKWLLLEAPEFRIFSQLNERQTRAWGVRFGRFIGALGENIRADPRNLPPLTLVLFAQPEGFRPYLPLRPDGKPSELSGYFSRRADFGAMIGLAALTDPGRTERVILHEGVHWYLSAMPYPRPAWLEEGLAEVFSTYEITRSEQRWGEIIPRHLRVLAENPPLPMARLLAVAKGDALHDEAERLGVFYARSWAFVHYLLFGVHDGSRDLLSDYFLALQSGVRDEEAFQRIFGTDHAGMDQRIDAYLRAGKYRMQRGPLPPTPPAPGRLGPAPAHHVEAALAQLALGGGNPALAEWHAHGAIRLQEADPSGHELLAAALREQGKEELAAAALRTAAARGSSNPSVYLDLAHQTLYGPGWSTPGPRFMVGRSDLLLRTTIAHLGRAMLLRPQPATAIMLADVLLLLEEPGPRDSGLLAAMQRMFPEHDELVLALATLQRRTGEREAAWATLRGLIAGAGDLPPPIRARARSLEERWRREDAQGAAAASAQGPSAN